MKLTAEKLIALRQHYERPCDFAIEKALRGEILSVDEYTHGTAGIPSKAFERVGDGQYRLRQEALNIADA